jgi:hypothetical protein
MKISFTFLRQTFAVVICAVAFTQAGVKAATAFVYDTGTEILTTGDFNNDGSADVLVLDKSTGNVRVGFLDFGGNLAWSAPLVSGVENVSSAAVGQFLNATDYALAVTAADLNRINLISLANTNSAGTPTVMAPLGIGPHTLVTLDNPLGAVVVAPTNLLVATSRNQNDIEQLERIQVFNGFAITPFTPAQFNEDGAFERGNALALNATNSPSFATGLVRGTNADRFDILQFTNSPGGILISYSNLPTGSDYAFGNFNGEPLPRFAFYQPDVSNLTVVTLDTNSSGLQFGTNVTVALTEAVQRVFYLPPAAGGTFLAEFSDGVQAITFSGNNAVAGAIYRSGLANSNNGFSGIVPLANGQFVLLDAAAGEAASTHAQVMSFNGTSFSQMSSSTLPAISSRTTRANVWLFQTEPFVNPDAGFIASLASPDWSDQINGLPGTFSVLKESDGGSGTGLGSFTTNNLGTPPTGANFGLPNQVADGISIFSYAPPRPAEPTTITISPPPGFYSVPIQVSFSTLAGGDLVFYRIGAADAWHVYSATFPLTNDASVDYYGYGSTSVRSRLLTANYSFASTIAAATTLNLTNGFGVTNNISSGTGSNGDVTLSQHGTVFYGRKNSSGGAVWAINLDGSGDTYITTGARPRVSRDGHYLAFMRGTNVFQSTGGDIWLRDLATGIERKFFTNNLQIVGYDWDSASPPNLILDYRCNFWSAPLSNSASIFPMTNSCFFAAPSVNPANGNLTFFDSSTGGGIRTSSANGGVSTHLGATIYGSRWPAWSPDGSRLSFAYLNNYSATYGMSDLYTINADGTVLAQITAFTNASDGFLYGAIWTPAGNCLLGAGAIYGTNGLWKIPLTSDGQHCDCPAKLLPTTAGDPIDFAGSVIVAPATIIAKPGLFIRADENAIVVYWSTNYQGFSLQAAASLNTNSSWTAITGPYFQNGGYYEYHEAKTALAATKFFRLQYPGTIILQPLKPRLSLQLDSGQTVLSWSTNYVGYTLESATNLNPPVIWSPLNASGVSTNGQFEFRQSFSLPREFFRLHW